MSDVTSAFGTVARAQLSRDGRCQQDMPPDWCAHCICGLRPKPKEPERLPAMTVGKPVHANFSSRCRCRPGCLSVIDVDDLIIRVLDDDGWALLEHTQEDS